MKLHIILTGATGMVGEGVLHEALQSPDVERVLVLTRKPTGMRHPKLSELVYENFYDLSPIESELTGYNACFFCLGVTSVGKKEEEYRHLTYDLTMNVARTLSKLNPEMTFSYISGMATDSTEHGRSMWARVKGKTENDLRKLPFKHVYLFRPGYLHPTKGLKNTLKYYKYITWLYPILRFAVPSSVSTLRELGLAMIHASAHGYPKSILEVKDIVAAAKPPHN
ncbi:MAG: epimerase [Bacteroidota bacterium]|nr:epimerase [Bacteroidota bacterium]MDP4232762.1 epimerase [Bacteroidota bacterium]MDP4242556.1 epimerase [Bacteroidota bacterium]MDP4289373.1 epimerase [Bacteroidota bacterium]